ncbi:hypothetical protein PIB30_086038 [Stylosanthes scabra]|uniref:Uncharacterized protein n=1 Tax=Stylosanthes scabra TaxID=79078 RepID=A0ABU6SVB4_9FABA|nr:hypothetical protein [Stylosanthes scabra]
MENDPSSILGLGGRATYQQESRELREAHKRTEARLNDLTELLHKFGGINVVQTTSDKDATIYKEEDDKEEEDEEDDEWLYDLLAKLAGVNSDSEDEYEDAEDEETIKEDVEEEMIEITEEATEKEESNPDKEDEFFIAIVYGGNEEKPKDLPEKYADSWAMFCNLQGWKDICPELSV